jgi:hypothetical protein
MTQRELINRTTNLLGVAITAVAGFAFVPEIFLENDWGDKTDDILLFVLAVIAVVWYKKGRNAFERTVMPVVFTGLGLAIKIMAIAVEFHDKDAVGDDMGGLLVFILGTLLVWWVYKKNDKGLV